MGWFTDGHIKYWWELSKLQKVVVVISFIVLWFSGWALLNLIMLGSVWGF